jgi:hypothetical protein
VTAIAEGDDIVFGRGQFLTVATLGRLFTSLITKLLSIGVISIGKLSKCGPGCSTALTLH